ncbi:unnamed protein product [Spirodela intermedia]|uniref:Hexosyltransferase n=1 Tax=Spirodela intermedia TaxID=51605 RepID=A0A7I8ILP9_SPIIN|nr:unnamed protein product [Spirodela intermedia]CAA6658768.1 unnamed protein product [Spirodela intermedia]
MNRAKKLGDLASRIAAGSTPKSLHCLAMRLMEERVAHPEAYAEEKGATNHPDLANPDLYHYAIFSDNVVAASVVVNSAVRSAAEPSKHVFHLVTDKMHLAAFQVWFRRRPPTGGARVEIRSDDFPFLNASYSPAVRMGLPVLDHLKFYLPEMFPRLNKVLLLEDDVVVQRDLSDLWWADLDGKVNGADKFSPRACAWVYGVNVFDLDAWRREKCTEQYHHFQNLKAGFYIVLLLERGRHSLEARDDAASGAVDLLLVDQALDKSWHVTGLGYNPSIGQDLIDAAAVVHFNGNMKPWLDIAMNQYKHLWTKHVDADMEFLQLCNFGL